MPTHLLSSAQMKYFKMPVAIRVLVCTQPSLKPTQHPFAQFYIQVSREANSKAPSVGQFVLQKISKILGRMTVPSFGVK